LIAISTYTEPVPVNTAIVEPVQAEPEENEELGEFAKLLAGLLQKLETGDIPPPDFSDVEADSGALMLEETDAANKTDFFGVTEKIRDDFTERDFDAEIPEEQFSVMPNAGNLFAGSLEPDVVDFVTEDYLPEISNLTITDDLPKAEPKPDFFMIDSAETASAEASAGAGVETDALTQSIAAQNAEESLHGAGGKKESVSKDRPVSKNEEIESFLKKTGRGDEVASLRGRPENESPGRLDELRSRRRDKVTFEVRDLRTGEANNSNNAQTRSYTVTETAAGRAHGETPVREITLELRLPEQHNGSTGQTTAQTTWEAKAGTAIENMLARELHQNFNGDIVRHASMALHDGGEGTIKIALKPESLGNVKIRLEMTENKITGHIVVESKEALNAFRKEIASLEQAFRDSGFTNADLNLSLTADGRNAQGWEQEPSSFTPRMIASRYDDSSRDSAEHDMRVVDVYIGRKLSSINMLA